MRVPRGALGFNATSGSWNPTPSEDKLGSDGWPCPLSFPPFSGSHFIIPAAGVTSSSPGSFSSSELLGPFLLLARSFSKPLRLLFLRAATYVSILKGIFQWTSHPGAEWDRIFAIYTSGRGLISRIYKGLKIVQKEKINSLRKWAWDLNRELTKEQKEKVYHKRLH